MNHPIPSLDTGRFTLRLWTPADIPALLDLDDDPQVTRYTGPNPPRPEREAAWLALAATPGARPCLCIRPHGSPEFVGWAFLRPFRDDTGDWELGYRLHRAWWGRGVGTEVAQALMAWGWQQPQIAVIGAVYEAANSGSRAIMLKVGMQDAGTRDYMAEGPLPYCEARRAG
jgi:RimJ/RimL family protein N-acetyltransferase